MRYSLFGRSSLFAQQYVLDHGLMMQWGFNKLVGGAVSKREAFSSGLLRTCTEICCCILIHFELLHLNHKGKSFVSAGRFDPRCFQALSVYVKRPVP